MHPRGISGLVFQYRGIEISMTRIFAIFTEIGQAHGIPSRHAARWRCRETREFRVRLARSPMPWKGRIKHKRAREADTVHGA